MTYLASSEARELTASLTSNGSIHGDHTVLAGGGGRRAGVGLQAGGGAGDDEDPGVGEEDVEAAELANAVVEHLRPLRVVAHVGRRDTIRWPQDRRPKIELVMMIEPPPFAIREGRAT